MSEVLFVLIAVFGAIAAGITDIRKGIVPNRLSFPLIFIGISGNFMYAAYMGDSEIFLELIKSIAAAFAIGYIFWLLGGWSAGDVKEFLFLAALIPRYPKFLKAYFSASIAPYPFIITVLINTFLVILPFILIYSFYMSYKKLSIYEFLKPLTEIRRYVKNAFIVLGAIAFGELAGNAFYTLAALLLLSVIREIYTLVVSGILTIFFALTTSPVYIARYFVLVAALLAFLNLFWNSINLLGKALQEEVKITELPEGTAIAEEIYIQDGKIFRKSETFTEKLKRILSEGVSRTKKQKTVIAAAAAAGVTAEELEHLKKYVAEGKLEDRIKIKKSMPFAPVIMFGLIISLAFGDIVGVH